MQTFLPYANFIQTASVLDRQRLGKQRVETYQILCVLSGGTNAWKNHPAVLMWKYNINSLVEYGLVVCDEWKNRGYKDNMWPRIYEFHNSNAHNNYPAWLSDYKFHQSHQSKLLQKNFSYYSQFNWDNNISLNYLWPVMTNDKEYVLIEKGTRI